MGLLYALNTAGAIVGCLLSGFVLIGGVGLAETIPCAAVANAMAGLGGLLLSMTRNARRLASAVTEVHAASEELRANDGAGHAFAASA